MKRNNPRKRSGVEKAKQKCLVAQPASEKRAKSREREAVGRYRRRSGYFLTRGSRHREARYPDAEGYLACRCHCFKALEAALTFSNSSGYRPIITVHLLMEVWHLETLVQVPAGRGLWRTNQGTNRDQPTRELQGDPARDQQDTPGTGTTGIATCCNLPQPVLLPQAVRWWFIDGSVAAYQWFSNGSKSMLQPEMPVLVLVLMLMLVLMLVLCPNPDA